MTNPEIILNLWAIHDPEDNVIYGLAGRAYYVSGTDEQKIALLKQLAVSDFVLALRMPVPERYCIESGGESLSGLCSLNELYNPATSLFRDLYCELEREFMFHSASGGDGAGSPGAITIPDNPLYVITALVEDDNGVIRAVPGT